MRLAEKLYGVNKLEPTDPPIISVNAAICAWALVWPWNASVQKFSMVGGYMEDRTYSSTI